jgi:hypothetical protein
MNILSELERRGVKVAETKGALSGYRTTPQGPVSCLSADQCDEGKLVRALDLVRGDSVLHPGVHQTVNVIFDTEYAGQKLSEEEAQTLAKAGKIFSFCMEDVYTEYYGFASDPELKSFFEHGYSVRSRRYIEKVMQDIGLTYYTDAEGSPTGNGRWEKFDRSEVFSVALNADTEVGKIDENHWLAQTAIQGGIDSYGVVKMHFDHHPSGEQILTAFDVRRFDNYHILGRQSLEVFTCWECGRTTHWLDVPGSLHEKLDRAEDHYCGC